jgi:hypothetical protein
MIAPFSNIVTEELADTVRSQLDVDEARAGQVGRLLHTHHPTHQTIHPLTLFTLLAEELACTFRSQLNIDRT